VKEASENAATEEIDQELKHLEMENSEP